jgi:hypothetical protein
MASVCTATGHQKCFTVVPYINRQVSFLVPGAQAPVGTAHAPETKTERCQEGSTAVDNTAATIPGCLFVRLHVAAYKFEDTTFGSVMFITSPLIASHCIFLL